MRKRMNYLAVMAAVMLLGLTACNEEAALTLPAEPQNPPVADNSGNVYITGDDFTWELGGDDEGDEGGASSIHAVTRTQLTVEDNVAKFTWTPGDRVGILPDQGAQVWFEIPTPEEGEEPTNVAAFDGGAWALKPTSDYAAYYPFVKDFDLDRTKVPVSYTGQAQTGNGTTAHLGAYDYQGARPSTTNGAGGVSFDFDHVGALVLLQFTVPTSGTQLKGVTLSADGAAFTTAGTYDLTSTEGFPITPTKTAESMTIGLDYTTTADDETVTLYFLCAPIDLSGRTVNVSVACGTEGKTLGYTYDGKNLQAGGGYLLKATVSESLSPDYLTFSASANQTLTFSKNGSADFSVDFQYSVNGVEWNSATTGEAITFGGEAGDLRLRAKSPIGTAKDYYNYYRISFGNATQVKCTGDIRTLIDWENCVTANTGEARFCRLFEGCTALTTAPELPATTLANSCYSSMFTGCTSLATAPELPATTLANSCYNGMFIGCTSLTTAPELPATSLADWCYASMFQACTSLTTAPELPVTTLTKSCYRGMFKHCDALTTAPELPATTLAEGCYYDMFSDCTSLTTAPELPATALAEDCYYDMFLNCTSLTTAPELPATTLANSCYSSMFIGCTSLTTAPELPATTLANSCYNGMFIGCTSLTTAPELPATSLADWCYASMFQACTSLTTAPELPVTTLTKSCYSGMFQGCTSLTTAPELPATTLTNKCYSSMFQGCTSLTTAPKLPAKTLANRCYYRMFMGCFALTTAPKLPATTLADDCYQEMFRICSALTTAPELLATTLTENCYQMMFLSCHKLTTAPVLPAKTLADGCYNKMFYNCRNLSSITMLATDISATDCLTDWVYDVSSSGTFYKNSEATWSATGVSGIPEGWTVVETDVPTEAGTEGTAE